MASEVFRFATIRQLSAARSETVAEVIAFTVPNESRFIDQVRTSRDPEARYRLLEIVGAHIASSDFATRAALDPRLLAFEDQIAALEAVDFAQSSQGALNSAFGEQSTGLEEDPVFQQARRLLGDSIVAACIEYNLPSEQRTRLTRLAGAWAVADALSRELRPARTDYEKPTIILPKGLFPLPRPSFSDPVPLRPADGTADRTERERLGRSIEALRSAVDDIVGVLRSGRMIAPAAPPAAPAPRKRSRTAARRRPGFVIDAGPEGPLSEMTREALGELGLSGTVEASGAIERLEERIARETGTLHRSARDFRMVRIGSDLIPADVLLPTAGGMTANELGRHPGPCSPPAIEPTGTGSGPATVPSGHGKAKVLGIAELMIVEQKLARYELGEIAHVENVLRGETRVRSNLVSTVTEETVTRETEESEETEKDLSTAERFELQSESQQVISENANKQAGLTITASYGPTVEATATASLNTTSSRQSAMRVASTFARETTTRAVSRVQKRTFERREMKTVRKFEERNVHRFEGPANDVVGIYRYLDKIYTAQVVNYGKRLMLEFIVPEPAAFWRYAQTRRPLNPVAIERPPPPGYCIEADGSFAPLQPQDITPDRYQYWASLYGAEGVEPPPPKTRIVSAAKKGPDPISSATPNAPKMSSDASELEIPDGYMAVKALVNAYGETQQGLHRLMIQVQNTQFQYTEPWDDILELALFQEATPKISVSINSLRFHNYEVLFTVFCVLRQEKYEEWQLKTYFVIMRAFEAARSRYQNAVEAAALSAGYATDFGRNPANNRSIEANELKRACITMMSGQHFETFDAMSRQAGPHGYPEINLVEAEAEARFVRLFEHGLDWMNITYIFYPYFWTRKDQWPLLSQLNDDDPLFAQFLRAGSARVQVPVRIGFEDALLNSLAGVEIWDADGNLINFDETGGSPQLPMLQELKSRLSNEFEEGEGRLALTQSDANAHGTGTAFTKLDERRRIRIGPATYVIQLIDAQTIVLDRPYEGATAEAATYALGPRLVGEPWEVRVPTDLVKLADMPIS